MEEEEEDLGSIFDSELQNFESLKILHNTIVSFKNVLEKEREKEIDKKPDDLEINTPTNRVNTVFKRKVNRNRGSKRKRINKSRGSKRRNRNEK